MGPAMTGVFIMASIVVAIFASFPYITYSPELWVRVLRQLTCLFVFLAYWLYFLISPPRSFQKRSVVFALFSLVYTFLYTAKWIPVDGIILREVSISMFVVTWFSLFYSSMFTSNKSNSKKEEIIANIQLVDYLDGLKLERRPSKWKIKIHKCNFLLICFDVYFGACIAPLCASLMEDYGYSISLLIRAENQTAPLPVSESAFLWTTTSLYLFFSVMYIVMVRSVPRKCRHFTCNLHKRHALVVLNIGIMALFAGILATIRLDASYSIMGRIMARLEVPESLGIVGIWVGILAVFSIDFLASYKIISSALSKWTIMLGFICKILWGSEWGTSQVLKVRTKQVKQCIRDASNVEIEEFNNWLREEEIDDSELTLDPFSS